MTESTISEIDDSERPIKARPEPEKTTKRPMPRFRPASMSRGPVIAGGIIRFDLGTNERR